MSFVKAAAGSGGATGAAGSALDEDRSDILQQAQCAVSVY